MVKCIDCSKAMSNKQISDYFALGCTVQREGDQQVIICQPCLIEREAEGEDVDSLIAEFCG